MFANSTVKSAPTTAAVTVTGGTTWTLTPFRSGMNGLGQANPNANLMVFAEDAANLMRRTTLAVEAQRLTTQKVNASGALITTPSLNRGVLRVPYYNSDIQAWVENTYQLNATIDQINTPSAEIDKQYQLFLQILGLSATLDMFKRSQIG